MKLKRLAAGITAAVMAFTVVGTPLGDILPEVKANVATVAGAAETYGDFEYIILDDGTVEIKDYNANVEKLDIPAEIDGKNVTRIGFRAFEGRKNLTSVTIPDSVTSINDYAFNSCTSLINIVLPNSVTIIGDYVFFNCTSLTTINVNVNNNNYTSVNGVLFNKEKTELIHYPAGKTDKNYIIPSSVTSIDDLAFSMCANLINIEIPNSVTSIGRFTFNYCTNLTSIAIPNSVTNIGYDAFENCTSLASVEISDNVTNIASIFEKCISLTAINVTEGNKNYTSVNGILFDKNETELVCYPAGKTNESYIMPNSVMSIGDYAFRGCINLINIAMPDSMLNIGDYAFKDCKNLAIITVPDSTKNIGCDAFKGTALLDKQTTPIKYADTWVISCDSEVESIIIKEDTKGIGSHAFSNCSNLTSITIPNSVTSIGDSAFRSCSNLTSITIPNSVTSIGERTFEYCTNLTSITIPNSVTSIGDNTFHICSNLTSITIPNSVTSIGERVFGGCESLASITIPYSVTSIGNEAFNCCSNLTSIMIPDSVTSIGNGAFAYCSNLTNITIPDSVTSIGRNAFYNCPLLINVEIPNSVVEIGQHAFGYITSNSMTVEVNDIFTIYCEQNGSAANYAEKNVIHHKIPCADSHIYSNEWTIDIESTLDNVGIKSHHCTKCGFATDVTVIPQKYELTYEIDSENNLYVSGYRGKPVDVVIPSEVDGKRVASILGAFSSCSSLVSITIPDSVKSIGGYTFYNCQNLMSVTIPNSVMSIGDYAFEYCNKLKHIHIPYGTNYSEYSGKGDLPTESEYYFELTANGYCTDKKCIMGLMPPDIEPDYDNPNGVIINDGSYSLSDSNATSNGVMSSISSGEKKDMTVDGGSLVIDGGLGKTYNIGTLTIKRGKLTISNAVVNIDNLIIYGDSEYDGLWINSSAKVNVNMYADVTGGYNRLFTLWKKQGGTLSVSGTLNVNRDLTIEKGGNFTQNAGSTIKVNGNVEFTSCYAPALRGGTLWVKGNFTHKSAKTTADSNHKTIFFGNTYKKLSVGSFKFGKLYLTNEADNGNNLKNVLRTENAPFGIMTCDANGTPVASRGKYLKDYDGSGEWYNGWIGSVSRQFDSYGSVSNKITGIEIVDKSVEESIYAKVETYAMLMATGLPDDMTGDSRNTCITFKNIKVNYKGKEKKATISFVYKDAIAKLKEYAALLDTSFPSDGMHLSSISYFVNIGNESFTGTYKMTAATNQKLFAQECLDIIDKGWKDDVKSYVKTYSNKLCGVAYSKIKKPEFVNTLMNAYKTYGSTNEKIEKWKSLMEKTMSTFDFADKLVSVHCPTDVYIYNKNGELVGSVINNVINLDEDSDIIIFVENSEKTIYLDDEKYDIKVLANGTGTMDYSVTWIGDDGEELKSMSYSGLTVDGDHVYTQDTDNANGSQLEGTVSGESITVSPTETTVGENIATNGHKLTVADNGGDDIWYCEDCGKYFSDEKGINEVNINAVSLLESISIGGAALDALNYTDKSYEYKVNAELRKPPEVTAVAKDSNAQISIEQADGLLGYQYQRTATVTVTSADGNNTSVYKIVFMPEDIVLSESDFTDTDYRDYIAGFDSNNDGILTADELTDAELPSTDHNFGEWTIKKEATCSEKGIATRTCADCDMTETASIPLVYHDYSDEWTTDKEPSCTEAGSKSHHCTRCKAKKDITSIPATGHTTVIDAAVAPTCTESGLTEGSHCSVCDEIIKEQEIIPALGHDIVNGICKNCKQTELQCMQSNHPYDNDCDQTWTIHREGAVRIDVTFTEDTYTESDYDYIYIYDGDDELIGSYSGDELSGAKITVNSDTVKIRLTSDSSSTEYGFALAKIEAFDVIPCDHSNTEIRNTKSANCITDGYTGDTYCKDCGELISSGEVIPATGKHEFGDWTITKAATCTATGTQTGICSVCGKTETQTINALGHDYSTNWTTDKAATCGAAGSKSYHCTRCGAKKDVTAMPATGKHDFNNWKTTKAATYTATGTKTRTCSKCGKVETATIAKLTLAKIGGFKVKAKDSTSITLQWNKNSSASGYIIEVYNGKTWSQVTKVTSNNTLTYKVTKLSASKTYQYRIKAYKTEGKATAYSANSATLSVNTNPSNMSGFKAKAKSYNSITLQWNKNASATGYELQKWDGKKWVSLTKIAKNSTTTYTVKSLKASTTYKYRIRAYKTIGKATQYSGYVELSVNTNPTNMSGYKVKSKTATSVTLQWNKNTSATGYELQKWDGKKWVTLTKIAKNSTTTYTVKSLKASTTYKYRIRAYKTIGKATQYSAYSATLSVNTNPSNMSGYKVKSKTSTSVTLQWNKNASATGYELQKWDGKKWVSLTKINKNSTTTYTVKSLKASTTYKYRIRAYKTIGKATQYSAYTAMLSLNTNPTNMSGFKAKSTAKTSVTLQWNKNTSATGYEIQKWDGKKWVSAAKVTKNSTTTYTVKSLKASITYKFRIRAYKTIGKATQYSSWSSTLTVKTKK